MKKLIALLLSAALALAAAGCGVTQEEGGETDSSSTSSGLVSTSLKSAEIDSTDLNDNWESEDYTDIDLSSAEYSSGGVVIDTPGVYRLSGSLNGSVTVETSGEVWLVFDGVYIYCEDSAPVNITSGSAVITLAEGSVNVLEDGGEYQQDANGDPSAALFSQNDLTINGSGSLSVTALAYNGIQCKDVLKIVGGEITVNAEGDGIKGRDALLIAGGSLNITAGKDGLNSNNDNGTGWGYIVISAGDITISAVDDGIQAVSAVQITGGELEVTAGGGAGQVISTNDSYDPRRQDFAQYSTSDEGSTSKGICCDGVVTISGGGITVNSADDAVHSNDEITVSAGTLLLRSGDDGIHADLTVTITGGEITITQSYEGIEAADITVNGGRIEITASDDGFNASDGSGDTATGGMWGFGQETGNCDLTINGGYIYVNAGGDGLDANGSIFITGGEVYVDGPSDSANGAIDSYNGVFVSGGTLIAAGAVGMAETLANSSSQPGALVSCSGSAGVAVTVTDQSGAVLASFTPQKSYSSLVISCPAMQVGESYYIYAGDTLLASFTQSSVSISVNGSSAGGFGQQPGTTTPGGEQPGTTMPGGEQPGTMMPGGGRM